FGLGTSGVWSARTPFDRTRLKNSDIGPSSHHVLRASKSLDDIVPLLGQQPRLTGINWTVARPGEIGAVEVTAQDAVLMRAEGDTVVRTNHYYHPAFAELSPRPDEYTSTSQRHARITEMLPDVSTAADMWAIAQDHLHYPQD